MTEPTDGTPTLSAARRSLLADLRTEKWRIGRVPVGHDVRMTVSQERMWLLDQVATGQSTANSPVGIRFTGALDVRLLRNSFAALLGRHDVLCVRCRMVDGWPMQAVHDLEQHPLPWRETDLSVDPAEVRRRRMAEDVLRPFDLRTSPPIRAELYRLDAEDHVLLVVLHHMVSDAQSDAILLRDLAELYGAGHAGREPSLPPLPIQYPDYAAWQRRHRTADVLAAATEHWYRRLAGAPRRAVLAGRTALPGASPGAGRFLDTDVPTDVAARLPELARNGRSSPFMVLTATFRAFLWRQLGLSDVVIGTPAGDRSRPDTQDLVGSFLTMLALRSPIAGDPSLRSLVAAERVAALDAFAHPDLPHEEVAARLRRDGGPAGTAALFDVTFSHEPEELAPPAFTGVRATRYEPAGALVQYPLMVKVVGSGPAMRVQWGYQEHLADERTIAALADRFLDVLDRATAEPDRPLAAVVPAGAAPTASPTTMPPAVSWVVEDDPDLRWSPLEELVCQVWAESMGDLPRRRDETFLDLGGSSLTAARLAYGLEEQFGVGVAVIDALDRPTVPEQAQLIEGRIRLALARTDRDRLLDLLREYLGDFGNTYTTTV